MEVLVAAAGFRTLGAIVEGQSQQAAYREAGAAHDYNAAVARQNADQAYKLANAQEAMQRRKARAALGEQAAQLAESGFTYEGSSLAVAKQSAENAELDSLMILYRGDMQARGYQAQAASEAYAGDVARANARRSRVATYFNVIGAPLGVYARAPLNAQPTTLGGIGYGEAGSAAATAGAGPW